MNSSPTTNHNAGYPLDSFLTTNAKRRTVVVVERASKSSLPSDEGMNAVSNGRVISNGKDLSHTIRGDTSIERSSDLSLLKKGVIAASVPSKRRRSLRRQEKPTLQTVFSRLTKNLLLLAALMYVGQVIWRWTGKVGSDNSPFMGLDSDNRISDVESSLKKATKMLQVQLDVVEKKIGNEIGIITREFTKQIEEKRALYEKVLKDLEARTDDLSNSLTKLKGEGLVSKKEFEELCDELKSRSLDVSDSNMVLDHIRAITKDIVEKEIEMHAADGLGRVDYALASGGARVVKHSEAYVMGKSNSWLIVKVKNDVHSSAQKMIEPSFGEPGQCFPLQGSSGFVDIRLRTGIIPDAVTLEHVSKSVAYDRSSAPRDCQVSGWFEGPEDGPSTHAKLMLLTEFFFDLDKGNVQTFPIPFTDSRIINMVRLNFTSNHGSSVLTCIYRFRVHGFDPSSSLPKAEQA